MFHLHAAAWHLLLAPAGFVQNHDDNFVREGMPEGARKSFSIATLMTELFSNLAVSKNDRPFSAAGARFTIRWRWI